MLAEIDRLQAALAGEIGLSSFERLCLVCDEIAFHVLVEEELIVIALDTMQQIKEALDAVRYVFAKHGLIYWNETHRILRSSESYILFVAGEEIDSRQAMRTWCRRKRFGFVDCRQVRHTSAFGPPIIINCSHTQPL